MIGVRRSLRVPKNSILVILNFELWLFCITFLDWLSWLFILWDILIVKIFYLFLNYCNLDILQDLIKEFKLNPVQYNFFSINTFLFWIVRPPRPWCWWLRALIYQANCLGLELSGQLNRPWVSGLVLSGLKLSGLSYQACYQVRITYSFWNSISELRYLYLMIIGWICVKSGGWLDWPRVGSTSSQAAELYLPKAWGPGLGVSLVSWLVLCSKVWGRLARSLCRVGWYFSVWFQVDSNLLQYYFFIG